MGMINASDERRFYIDLMSDCVISGTIIIFFC